MLAFDIETEGLDMYVHRITVACVLDPDKGISESFVFLREQHTDSELVEAFLRRLDEADVLCAFNGPRFDIPFIVHQFRVPHSRYSRWLLKLFDYFEVCRLMLSSTCSLNELLQNNGIPCKTSSGTQAIVWAKQGRWTELCDYCMSDTALTHALCSRQAVSLPLGAPRSAGSRGRSGAWIECRKCLAEGGGSFASHPGVQEGVLAFGAGSRVQNLSFFSTQK